MNVLYSVIHQRHCDTFPNIFPKSDRNLSHLPKRKGPENGRATKPKQLSKAVEGFLSWIRTPSDGSIELAQQTCVEWLWEWEREGSKTRAVLPADRARDTEEAAHSSGDEKTQADCREAETLCSQNPSPENADGSIELAQQTCVEWLWEWEREGSKTGAVLPADRARDTEEAAHSSGDEKTQADCRETEILCSQNPSPENAVGRSKRVLKRKLPFAEYGESTGEPPLKVRVRNDYTIVPSDSSALNPPCASEEEPEARKEPSSRKRRMTEALDNEPPKKRRILVTD
ncbi:hypothetical protein EOD39_18347 [Acipenser ruthenus]|uniref:Uncharacterized protein n=1 Tax=Acipenser ruthenus TaxID=7906 RepID=A0A444V145_ACIRT|nr:hypothetical protein EOD39_18347 [Acipenser ruthenus]